LEWPIELWVAHGYSLKMKALNPQPEGLKIEDLGDRLVVTRKWYTPSVWLTALFCVIWNAFMFNWYSIALNHPSPNNIALWFPVIHVGVGIYLAYSALTGFLNRTVFTLGNGKVVVQHGPLPWPGNKTIDSVSVQQFFCDEVVRRGRGGSRSTFRLNAVMKDGRKEVLFGAGIARDQVLYIEQIAEARLGIAPAPVVGELT